MIRKPLHAAGEQRLGLRGAMQFLVQNDAGHPGGHGLVGQQRHDFVPAPQRFGPVRLVVGDPCVQQAQPGMVGESPKRRADQGIGIGIAAGLSQDTAVPDIADRIVGILRHQFLVAPQRRLGVAAQAGAIGLFGTQLEMARDAVNPRRQQLLGRVLPAHGPQQQAASPQVAGRLVGSEGAQFGEPLERRLQIAPRHRGFGGVAQVANPGRQIRARLHDRRLRYGDCGGRGFVARSSRPAARRSSLRRPPFPGGGHVGTAGKSTIPVRSLVTV